MPVCTFDFHLMRSSPVAPIKLFVIAAMLMLFGLACKKKQTVEDWSGHYVIKQILYTYWADTITKDSIVKYNHSPGGQPSSTLEFDFDITQVNGHYFMCHPDSCHVKGYSTQLMVQGDSIDFGKHFFIWSYNFYVLKMRGKRVKDHFEGMVEIMSPQEFPFRFPGIYYTGSFQLLKK